MMVEQCRGKVLIVLILNCWLKAASGDNAFIDDPPDGYYKRTSLDDCPNRFYSEDVSSALVYYILGGLRAFRSEFPHMAAIGWTNNQTGIVDYACGGSLISPRYVVTAGHCGFDDKNVPPDTVRMGDTDLVSTEDDTYAQDIRIRNFIAHPNYKRTQKYYDIALIELDHEARLDAAVCPICLWSRDNMQQFTGGLQVAGFGVTDYASDRSPTLQKATLNYYDYETCNRLLPRPRSLFRGLSSDQFCAKTPMKDTCQGDSGGPVQVELSDVNKAIPFLVGVTSFGTGCWDGSFGVYTKVASYVNWIRSIVNVTVDPLECARQSVCLSSRKISDSRISPQNNSPFFRVELTRGRNSFNHCSGALIDYRHVVTSASCTNWNNLEPTQILANDQLISISEINRHPQYVPGKRYHDIAVLRLDKFYNQNKIYQIVAPACIWKRDNIPEPIAFYSGYGPDSSGQSATQVSNVPLKILTAFFLDNGRCNANYSAQFKSELPGGFNGDFVCAENPIDLVPGICKLEPGGPISNFRRDNVVPYVYGVNTLGEECGGPGNLFVATRISSYYDWIESIVLNRTEKAVDTRFDYDDSENEISFHPLSRGDFPYESELVSYVLPGLIASDPRLKPYGDQLVPGGLKPLATASVHYNLQEDDDDAPLKLTIYGTQLNHILTGTDDILQTLRSIPIQHPQTSSSNVEIIKSLELGVPQSSHETTFLQPIPHSLQNIHSAVPTLAQLWPKPTPLINSVHYHPAPTSRRLMINPLLPSPSTTSPALSFSIVKSIELYQDGHCTLSSGRVGRCVPYSRCNGSSLSVAVFGGGLSYCNHDLLVVCCPI